MPSTLPAFDRTYEGLKLPCSGPPRLRSGAFDRTYEGLKRDDSRNFGAAWAPLLTVPMRV